jgi:phosphoribosyl 1,2-cyclic phosphodiesterase
MPLHVQTLGSSSGGNSTLIWSGRSALLVDFGFPPSYLDAGLRRNGLSWENIKAVLVTHTHGDHVNLPTLRWLKDLEIPLVAPEGVIRGIKRLSRNLSAGLLPLPGSRQLKRDDFHIAAFEVPHDSPGGCFGYRISVSGETGMCQLAIATDLGFADNGLPLEFAGSDLLVIESNHDPEMLENSLRPDWLKKRIREVGHLSNPQSAALVGEILSCSQKIPSAILLAHLSQECNTEPLAASTMMSTLRELGFDGVRTEVSHATHPSALLSVL